jgi:hypothetical protein
MEPGMLELASLPFLFPHIAAREGQWAMFALLFSEQISNLFFSMTLVAIGVLCTFVILMGLVGSLIDGIAWNILDHTRGCYSPYDDVYYGQSEYQSQAMQCTSAEPGDPSTQGFCYCVQADNIICYHYDIANYDKYDCNDLLHTYTNWLHDSTIICSVITVGSLIYCIFLCTGGCVQCCSRKSNTHSQPPTGFVSYPAAPPLAAPTEAYAEATRPLIDDMHPVQMGYVVEEAPDYAQNPYYAPQNNTAMMKSVVGSDQHPQEKADNQPYNPYHVDS